MLDGKLKFKCHSCGEVVDYPDIREWDEPRGEFWGMPCSEHMIEWYCPVCGSDDIDQDFYEDEEEEEYDG